MTAARLSPLPRDQWDETVRDALRAGVPAEVAERFLSTGEDAMRVPNALATMVHNPAVAGPFLAYNAVLLRSPGIDPRLRELMVLRVAWRARADYEWAQHVRLAPRYGITEADIASIADGATADCWSAIEADALRATDELLDDYRVSDETWQRLAAALGKGQLVELLFVVGTYACLAMVFNSLDLERDPELVTDSIPPVSIGGDR